MRYDPNRFSFISKDDYNEEISWMKTYVSTFTENYMEERGEVPTMDDFIETHPMYDHEALYAEIQKEIDRVSKLVKEERE